MVAGLEIGEAEPGDAPAVAEIHLAARRAAAIGAKIRNGLVEITGRRRNRGVGWSIVEERTFER